MIERSVLALLPGALTPVLLVGLIYPLLAQSLPDASPQAQSLPFVYSNPLTITDPATGPVVSCPDPATIKLRLSNIDVWYLYCTGDPLNSNDQNADGSLKNHYIAIHRSFDLIH